MDGLNYSADLNETAAGTCAEKIDSGSQAGVERDALSGDESLDAAQAGEHRAAAQTIDSASDGQTALLEGGQAAAFDPLLDSFADRYIFPWEDRELGRIDSPLYLRSQLEEAGKLFELARFRWKHFDMEAWGAPIVRDWTGALRDVDHELWDPRTIKLANQAHFFLRTHFGYDLSKPGELSLGALRTFLAEEVPSGLLYASVAMCCAVKAAEACYDLSRLVESAATKWRKVNLSELYSTDGDRWYQEIHTVFRDLAEEVAECREDIATYLGAADTARVLAHATEVDQALQQVEKLNVELREQIGKKDVELGAELSRRMVAEEDIQKQRVAQRESERVRTEEATKKRQASAEARMKEAAALFKEEKDLHPSFGADCVAERVCGRIKVTRRTLDTYLSEARRRKLLN